MGEPLHSLLEVSDTMLITLYARARESLSRDPIIRDVKAVEMIMPGWKGSRPEARI